MKNILTVAAALLGLSALLLPAPAETTDASQLLAQAPGIEAAMSILQKQVAQRPIVLLVRLQAADPAQASVVESYKGGLTPGSRVCYQPLADGPQAETAYLLARSAHPLADGSIGLQDCLIVPRLPQGSPAQTAMHATLVRAQLIKVQEER